MRETVDDVRAVAAEKDFSGVVVVSRGSERLIEFASGFADRANQRPNTLETRFGIASVAPRAVPRRTAGGDGGRVVMTV